MSYNISSTGVENLIFDAHVAKKKVYFIRRTEKWMFKKSLLDMYTAKSLNTGHSL